MFALLERPHLHREVWRLAQRISGLFGVPRSDIRQLGACGEGAARFGERSRSLEGVTLFEEGIGARFDVGGDARGLSEAHRGRGVVPLGALEVSELHAGVRGDAGIAPLYCGDEVVARLADRSGAAIFGPRIEQRFRRALVSVVIAVEGRVESCGLVVPPADACDLGLFPEGVGVGGVGDLLWPPEAAAEREERKECEEREPRGGSLDPLEPEDPESSLLESGTLRAALLPSEDRFSRHDVPPFCSIGSSMLSGGLLR